MGVSVSDRPAILTQLNLDTPPEWRWSATYGPYDLDDPVGHGCTEPEAIADLKWKVGEGEATP